MIKCSICKENYAVVFITKIYEGRHTQEGLCLSCAKKQGIRPLENLIGQMGISDEDVDALTKQMGEIISNMEQLNEDPEALHDKLQDPSGFYAEGLDGGLPGIDGGLPDMDGSLQDTDGGPKPNGAYKDGDAADGAPPGGKPAGARGGKKPGGAGAGSGSGPGADQAGKFGSIFGPKGFYGALTMFPPKGGDDQGAGKSDFKTKTQEKRQRKKKYLDLYGANLTELAKEGKIDRVIGRQKEIDRTIQILNRRLKNNPILIGEPGVGKTAIAEGLAVRIVRKEVPAKLYNYEIYRIDMTTVIAGTQFRGQFESRMKGIVEEAKSFSNIILVFDEIHNLLGAGEADGAMNAANILKPALARGELQVVGATTLREYRRHVERDQALERRFQPVLVEEPSLAETVEILRGIRDYYENYHKVRISDEIIDAAANLSERYISDRFLPDKAIDVIDEAASRSNLANLGLVELERLKEELRDVQEEKDYAISVDSIEDYQKAAELKTREYKLIELIREAEGKYVGLDVTLDDVAQVIEAWTKIPVQKLTENESKKLLALEDRIHRRLIGQREAVETVCRSIRRSRSGFRKEKKPASFIFVGPTGVGKTELVKALAREIFESEEALIRLDMSEYMEKHTVSKLIGSPPGYIGYDDAGQLTEKVRRKPYSIILLDEIEKAHPDVFNILLQILDDGRLTDSQGRTVHFENTILIMTSNAGTSFKSANIGFGGQDYHNMERKVQSVLREIFRPEFLNRVDSVAVFKELERDELKAIIRIMLDEVVAEASGNGIEMSYDAESLPEYFLSDGYQRALGARPFRIAIQKKIEDTLSEMYLRGEIVKGSKIYVEVVSAEADGGAAAAGPSVSFEKTDSGGAGDPQGGGAEREGGAAEGPPDGGEAAAATVVTDITAAARQVLRFIKV